MDEFASALGARLRAARSARGLNLDGLATASGVSRSMISDIERGTKMPTVLVLARLATALGTTVSRLIGEEQPAPVVVLRRASQTAIVDAAGWERRILSPSVPGVEFEFIRTTVPPGVEIGSFPPHAPGAREWVAVEAGSLTVELAGTPYELSAGDSIYYAGDVPHAFANRGRVECVYYTAMEVP
jgi:XRE family transcriptional regulator, regulator of sulfur utilization